MDVSRYQRYVHIREHTYHIVESTFFHAVQVGFSEALTAKGLNTLYQIARATVKELPSISELSDAAGIPLKTYSKRLQPLIQAGYLESSQDPHDHRRRNLQLTDLGRAQLKAYQSLIQALLTRLKQTFGRLGLLRYVQSLIVSANYLNDTPSLSKWAVSESQYRTRAAEALNRIYVGVSKAEHPVLETYFSDLSLKEARIVVEIHIQASTGRATLKTLEESLKIPKATLSRTVSKFAPKFIHKKTDEHDHRVVYLSIKPNMQEGFDAWIDARIDVYERLEKHHTKKDYARILKSFKILETLLLEKIAKDES